MGGNARDARTNHPYKNINSTAKNVKIFSNFFNFFKY
jgi:hypothetical protein